MICVGKIKEQYFTDACLEYQKRLSKFCSLHIIEIEEARLSNESEADITAALQKEGQAIIKHIEGTYAVALCVEGENLSSPAFSKMIERVPTLSGRNKISFVIGSSHGLSEEVKKRADGKLSFSALTFPHQLVRVMLIEQIYRAFCIAAGNKYHK